jgi:acyl carrier protein
MNPLQKIQSIFREFFDDPTLLVTPESSPSTLPEWDSVAQVHIILAVEEAFDMRFTTDEVAKVHCVADILRVLESRA